MEAFNNFVTAANGILWGPIMLVALVGTHIYLSATIHWGECPPTPYDQRG